MNIYVVTEGKTESVVYKSWIPLVNPILSPINYITEASDNNFFIVSSMGYPYYFEVIENAIHDVNDTHIFDRLVITVDAEDMSRQEKYNEVLNFVGTQPCAASIHIVIQHFCFETWALGNRKVIRRNPSLPKLNEYKKLFDVRLKDPELLPPKPDEGLNRSQFAEKYLRLALNDRYRNLTYSKSEPRALVHPTYFEQVRLRHLETIHIDSFGDFLRAFV